MRRKSTRDKSLCQMLWQKYRKPILSVMGLINGQLFNPWTCQELWVCTGPKGWMWEGHPMENTGLDVGSDFPWIYFPDRWVSARDGLHFSQPFFSFVQKNTGKAINIVTWFKNKHRSYILQPGLNAGVESLLPCLSRIRNFLWSCVQP